MPIKIGNKVIPKCPAGLWLADVPWNGDWKQEQQKTCVFQGTGTVIDVRELDVDYSKLDDIYKDLGIIRVRHCLIEFDGGLGWAGEGTLIKQ
jgi:hypothetical protein